MRFTGRLIVITAIVVVAFTVVATLSLQMLAQSRLYDNTIRRLDTLSAQVWRLQSTTYQVFAAAPVDDAYELWSEIAARMTTQLEEFMEAPETQRLALQNPEFGEDVTRLDQIATFAIEEIENFREDVSEVTNGFTEFPSQSLAYIMYNESLTRIMGLYRSVNQLSGYLDETLHNIVTRLVGQLQTMRETSVAQLQWSFIGVQILALVAIVVLILVFRGSLRRRFGNIHTNMERLAAGDFTVVLKTDGRDELSAVARYVQEFVDSFSGIIANIKSIAQTVTDMRTDLVSAAQQSESSVTEIVGNIGAIADTVGDLDETIETTKEKLAAIDAAITALEGTMGEQTQAVSESSSAVEQMTASINNISNIADERRQAAQRLREASGDGQQHIDKTDANVGVIAGSVDEILQIISVINNIASQTSILAMNAAIEAAHAGEYGRGFAVVADEIRKLSDSTNRNSKQIREQLEHVVSVVGETHSMSAETKRSFGAIQDEVEATARAFDEINATMRELASGTESVMRSSAKVGDVTGTIQTEVKNVASQSHDITSSMDHVRNISSSVRTGMDEIKIGTSEINTTLAEMKRITEETYEHIGELHDSVAGFQVEADAEREAQVHGDSDHHGMETDDSGRTDPDDEDALGMEVVPPSS